MRKGKKRRKRERETIRVNKIRQRGEGLLG